MSVDNDFAFGHVLLAFVFAGIIGLIVGAGLMYVVGPVYDVQADYYDREQKIVQHDKKLYQLVPVRIVVKAESEERK